MPACEAEFACFFEEADVWGSSLLGDEASSEAFEACDLVNIGLGSSNFLLPFLSSTMPSHFYGFVSKLLVFLPDDLLSSFAVCFIVFSGVVRSSILTQFSSKRSTFISLVTGWLPS